MNDSGIKHIQTSTHAPSAERFIRTFKDGLKQDTSDWVKHVENIVDEYNNTEHNTTKSKPLDTVEKHHVCVNWHLQNNAKHRGNTLRLMMVIWLELILTNKFAKGHEPNRSRERYRAVGIKCNHFLVSSINKYKLYLRHELLKV